jgi:hypothetical protein
MELSGGAGAGAGWGEIISVRRSRLLIESQKQAERKQAGSRAN